VLAEIADQTAGKDAGAGLGVHVVDGVELRLADAENRHMAPVHQGDGAGVGQDVFHRADGGPFKGCDAHERAP